MSLLQVKNSCKDICVFDGYVFVYFSWTSSVRPVIRAYTYQCTGRNQRRNRTAMEKCLVAAGMNVFLG